MKRWRLNSIAARIAVTIVLAIIFALELAVGASINRVQSLIGGLQDKGDTYFFANRFGILTLDRRRNPLVISAKIATIARIVAQASPLERPQVLAAMAEPTLQHCSKKPNYSITSSAHLTRKADVRPCERLIS